MVFVRERTEGHRTHLPDDQVWTWITMAQEDLQSILKTLPRLTAEERKQVLEQATMMNLFLKKDDNETYGSGETYGNGRSEQELCYESFRSVLRDGGLSCPPWSTFQRLDILRHYEKGYQGLENYVSEQFSGVVRIERQKLYKIFGELLVSWMKENRVPMKIGLFFKNLNLVPELVSKAFPGYAEQGWLKVVLIWGDRRAGT